jgi:lipopolysaccharide transport system ATP-binding protein
MTNIIEVENLSKRYLVGHLADTRSRYVALRDVIARGVRDFARKTLDMAHGRQIVQGDEVEEFWALKDLSFKVQEGEVLGIIGRNGAGKSTLLKILSRITDPTEGRVVLRGRVASLLEVGTRFHPELTGRENIYLNGAILGMTQREIKRKFDEIVAFAEVGQFIDTPVKRYSSGMYVRLAFSVAAHLEPEILIVDEVLAVGDAAFQKKCLGKMSDVASQQGRTVLFVSHNMPAIQALCTRAALLSAGKLCAIGNSIAITDKYLRDVIAIDQSKIANSGKVVFHGTIKQAWLENEKGQILSSIGTGDSMRVCFEFACEEYIAGPGFGCGIEDVYGKRIFSINNYMLGQPIFDRIKEGIARFYFPQVSLLPGTYYVTISIVRREIDWVDKVEQAVQFTVDERDIYGTGKLPTAEQGIIFQRAEISVTQSGQ